MRIKGHPVHMMLVHFPSTLLPLNALCSWINYFYPDNSLIWFSFYTLLLGVVSGWVAVLFGGLEMMRWYNLKKSDRIMTKVLWHAGIHLILLTVFTLLCMEQVKVYPDIKAASMWVIWMKTLLIVGLIVANYIGGELVLKYYHSNE